MGDLCLSCFFHFSYLNLVLSPAQASQQTIEYTAKGDGAQLFSTQTHTEYTYEDVLTTCSRQVQDGHETICDKHLIAKRRICRRVDGRTICTDDGTGSTAYSGNDDDDDNDDYTSHTNCYDRPIYRTEYY